MTDGAAAVLLMRRSCAVARGLPILGVFRSFAAVGVDPSVMGVGPAVAIPAAVKRAGVEVGDVDLFELNEAFASQVCVWGGHFPPYLGALRGGNHETPPFISSFTPLERAPPPPFRPPPLYQATHVCKVLALDPAKVRA